MMSEVARIKTNDQSRPKRGDHRQKGGKVCESKEYGDKK